MNPEETDKLKKLSFSDEQIRAKAYQIWQKHPEQSSEDNWDAAIKALRTEKRFRYLNSIWRWTGFSEKKGWDILQLIVLPLLIALWVFSLQQVTKEREQKLSEEKARQELKLSEEKARQESFSKYLDQMSDLMINRSLRDAKPGSEVFILAQSRTTLALRQLDSKRQNLLFQFLRSADLLSSKKGIGIFQDAYLGELTLSNIELSRINLRGSNLYKANLRGSLLAQADLSRASLIGANLKYTFLAAANLSNARLWRSNLSRANLSQSNLTDAEMMRVTLIQANLSDANLSNTNLNGADLTNADLSGANLNRATFRCGSVGISGFEFEDITCSNLSGANLSGANLTDTDLSKAKNLVPQQIKQAKNWKAAKYDPDFRKQLGLVSQP